MVLQEGQEAKILVGDSTPIQYFEPQTDDDSTTFVLRTLDEPTGLRATGVRAAFSVISRAIPEEVDVAVALSARAVGKRAPLDGVFLNVGKPQVTRTEYSGTHRVALGRWASLLGSADTGSALLLLFKVSSLDKLLSAGREEPPPVDYVMEARILRYEGRLEKEFAKAHPSGATQKAIKLYDAVLPLKGKRVDLNAKDAWDNLEKIRGMELLSAPRLTLQQSDVMRKKQVKTKVVLRQNMDMTQLNEGLLEALSRLAPDGHVLPVSESDRIGKGIIADVIIRWIPYEKATTENRPAADISEFKEVTTGVLLMVGVDATENPGYVRANIYGQIRLPMKNTEFPGEDLKEALASLVFIELQDEFTIAHGKWTAYVASVSETEHYFTLLTFRPMLAKKATSN